MARVRDTSFGTPCPVTDTCAHAHRSQLRKHTYAIHSIALWEPRNNFIDILLVRFVVCACTFWIEDALNLDCSAIEWFGLDFQPNVGIACEMLFNRDHHTISPPLSLSHSLWWSHFNISNSYVKCMVLCLHLLLPIPNNTLIAKMGCRSEWDEEEHGQYSRLFIWSFCVCVCMLNASCNESA